MFTHFLQRGQLLSWPHWLLSSRDPPSLVLLLNRSQSWKRGRPILQNFLQCKRRRKVLSQGGSFYLSINPGLLVSTSKAGCNAAQVYRPLKLFDELMKPNWQCVCKIWVISGRQHGALVHTSQLWSSSLDGRQASSHSVAHPLQETRTANTHQGRISHAIKLCSDTFLLILYSVFLFYAT